ncbi:MAG: 3-dehydroquinate synthase [Pseudomonadales bacterium]|nr:3-dehydroquinate synthase [Pseudomonadales bacterium]
MKTLQVALAERSYPIHIGAGLLDDVDLLRACVPGRQVAVVTNDVVGPLYAARLTAAFADRQLDVLTLPDGESHKTLATWGGIHEFLAQRGHHRATTIVALGGGVVGDMAGFAAATWQRGARFVQIPTTLLAQVDSSVGGKTGVNLAAGKNLVGAFHQPAAVIADTSVLATLPEREYRAGLAEVLKYGFIADAAFLDTLLGSVSELLARETNALTQAIERSCAIKAEVVAGDEREEGRRAILNFGHTFGHAIEKILGYGELLHGEAVAVGMVMAADLSWRCGRIGKTEAAGIKAAVAAFGLAVERPASVDTGAMLHAFGMDKKVVDGRVRFVLANGPGDVEVTADIPEHLLRQTLQTTALCEQDG